MNIDDFTNVPLTMAEVSVLRRQNPLKRGKTRTQIKGAKDRAEAKVINRVRAHDVARDGHCIVTRHFVWNDDRSGLNPEHLKCDGKSEWAHTHERRRSKTRGLAPEERHTTAQTFMACTKHHDQYDGRQYPRLFVTMKTRLGADGGMKMRHGK